MSLSKTKKIYKNYKRKKKYQSKNKSKKRYQSKKNKSKKRYQSNKSKSKKSKDKKRYKTKKYKRKYRSKILLGGNPAVTAVTAAKPDTNTNTDTDPAPEPAPKPQNIISTMFDFFANDDDKKNFEELDEAFNTAKDPIKLFESCLDPDSVNLHPEDKIIKSKYCDSIRHYRDKTIEKLKKELHKGVEQGRDLTKILEEYNIGESDIAAIACDEVLGIAELSGLCVLIRKMLNFEHELPINSELGNIVKQGIPDHLKDQAINHVSNNFAENLFKMHIKNHAKNLGHDGEIFENKAKNGTQQNRQEENPPQQSSLPLDRHPTREAAEKAAHDWLIQNKNPYLLPSQDTLSKPLSFDPKLSHHPPPIPSKL